MFHLAIPITNIPQVVICGHYIYLRAHIFSSLFVRLSAFFHNEEKDAAPEQNLTSEFKCSCTSSLTEKVDWVNPENSLKGNCVT